MSDLVAGPGGTGRAYNGASRSATGPVPVPRAQGTGGLRTPRDIMNERARRRAEQEAVEADLAEEQRRATTELQRRQSAERRAQAAGVVGQSRDSGYRSAGHPSGSGQPMYPSGEPAAGTYERGSASTAYPTPSAARPRGTTEQSRPSQASDPSSRPQYNSRPQQAQQPSQPSQSSRAPQPGSGAGGGPSQAEPTSQPRSNTSSFPHAFERWEDLSSRWEGLTSYWLRRLEGNAEITTDPIAQQMSRQITDLSAAGANLFHAVVELQRLRASSERKFQRWFFETRAEQERLQEDKQRLQTELESQRQAGRADISGVFAKVEQEREKSRQVVDQMRRELQISKDEARRAWEELGRWETKERDRTYALKEGQAVNIGGVNVLPVGAPSRGGNVPRQGAREGPAYVSTSQGAYELQEPSPTDTDPFTEAGRAGGGFPNYPSSSTQRGPSQPQAPQPPQAPQGPYARQPAPSVPIVPSGQRGYPQPGARFSPASEESEDDGGYEIDERGNVRVDPQGQPIPFRRGQDPATLPQDPGDIEAEDLGREQRRAQQYGRSESSTQVPQSQGPSQGSNYGENLSPADYEGRDFGTGTGWEGMPRHQHPTSLSDVLEEDEHSHRTST